MAANPIPEAVVSLAAESYVLNGRGGGSCSHSAMRAALEAVADSLTAAQQQGQAVAYPTGSDREVLQYLMQQFDAEQWDCPRCGHSEATADMDSADYLRRYLTAQPTQQGGGDGMLPDALVPHAKEWYRLCERRFSVDRMTISGKLAEAIVEAVTATASPSAPVGVEALRASLLKLADDWEALGDDLMVVCAGHVRDLLAQQPAAGAVKRPPSILCQHRARCDCLAACKYGMAGDGATQHQEPKP